VPIKHEFAARVRIGFASKLDQYFADGGVMFGLS